MQRISTNLTLFFKLFIPTFWLVFFGAVTLATLLTSYTHVGGIARLHFQLGMLAFYLSGAALLYFTLIPLKRVEMDEHFVYVTNYFKSVRYPYHQIERLEISRFLFFQTATIHLRSAGSFGRRLRFIPSAFRLQDFLEENPAVRTQLTIDGAV